MKTLEYRDTGIALAACGSENRSGCLPAFPASQSRDAGRNKIDETSEMAADTNQIHDKDKRRDAVNAVRLMCLDHHSAAAASKTFNLYPCDVVAARRLLDEWPHHRARDTTEHQRVEYLLSTGWRKRKRTKP